MERGEGLVVSGGNQVSSGKSGGLKKDFRIFGFFWAIGALGGSDSIAYTLLQSLKTPTN
jgi:hypothetical protein